MRSTTAAFVLSALIAAVGCRENPIVPDPNEVPTADARIIGPDGQPIDETVDGGSEALHFDYNGSPVKVTLDGTLSNDPDGEIVEYRWLSSTIAPDGGVPAGQIGPDGSVPLVSRRWVPDAKNDPGWPDDVKQPVVELPSEGAWSFTLWVVDDKGATSDPDTVTITVGAAVDPAVTECVNNVVSSVDAKCAQCVCGISEMCRNAVVQSACDDTCWGLIQCIGANCPDFAAMSMQNPPDYSCVTTNCSDFISAAMPAGPAGMCVTMCPDDCTAM